MPSHTTPRFSLRHFLGAYLLTAAALAAATGVFLHTGSRGSDAAMVDWRFMRMTWWYLVDIHVVLSFAALAAGAAWGLLRLAPRRRPTSLRVRALASCAGAALAVYTAWYVIDEHPVLVHDARLTDHLASVYPDQLTLTWASDPAPTQSVQWRTAHVNGEHFLRYRPADGGPWTTVAAETARLEDPHLVNEATCLRHTAALSGLAPGTAYTCQAGNHDLWSPPATFTTADPATERFSFVYMGDVQTGIEAWSGLIAAADAQCPDAAFHILAGDLVNKGCHRDEWDALFHAAGDVFARKPLVPIIGNHDDCDDGGPWMYLELLDLPKNGPAGIEAERAWSFTYGNAFFVGLDSNLDPDTQTAWLEEQLAGSDARWKFVLLHHPAYSSKPHRDNREIREAWTPVFDRHHVAIAFQGHDHAYTRTWPLRGGERIDDPDQGVNYVLAVAGDKYYEQEERDFVAVARTELSTYQVIDIDGGRLHYRAFDLQGNLVDELRLSRPASAP